MSRIAICFVTYERTEYAVRTIQSVCANLDYPELGWYVGDDGSSGQHVFAIHNELTENQAHVFGSHSQRIGPGASWNKAWRACHEWSDLVLWVEDDWELRAKLPLEPYVTLLNERSDVGMVRLGHLAVGLDLHSVGHGGKHYLRVEKSTQYAYSGNPSLRHKRFLDNYGGYPENTNPGDTEVGYDAHIRRSKGPQIWWPVDLGGWSVWGHIGEKQSY